VFAAAPADFMFLLDEDEVAALRSQIATLKTGRGRHRKYRPYAFTEHGATMAAAILNSARAVEVSVYVVRAFVKLRELLASNKNLSNEVETLERRVESHDTTIVGILRQLMKPMSHLRDQVD
jgi:phage regulator Rha-like protein